MHDEPEAVLIDRARAGDHNALTALLERHEHRVYRFGMKLCGDREDAREVLQETLLTAARDLRDFRGEASLSTWLYTVARSHCIKRQRKKKLSRERDLSIETDVGHEAERVEDPGRGPERNLEGKQVERALEDAIASLEEGYREVLVLRDVEGLTAPEVAMVMGITQQAVKSRLHRARASVRAVVAPLLGEDLGAPAVGCPDVLEVFSRHLEGEIRPENCREMQEHLAECARCRGVCASLEKTLALCRRAGPRVEVPEAVQRSVRVALKNFLADRV